MEDYCWEVSQQRPVKRGSIDTDKQDVILDPESSLPLDQQKKEGLGSFFNFRVRRSLDDFLIGHR